MHSRLNPHSVGAHWDRGLATINLLCVYISVALVGLYYYSWQFCERDLEGIGRGLGEAVYRYHRMLMSKRLTIIIII
jgi:hypothetical protein